MPRIKLFLSIILYLSLFLSALANAHEAPAGWAYDSECCHSRDCKPAEGTRMSPTGLQMKSGGTWYDVPPSAKRKQSKDAMNHICISELLRGKVLCVYLSAGI